MIQEKGVYKRTDALKVAEAIARKFGEPRQHFPKILEIMVFGSTANGTKDTVGDLDVALLVEYPNDPKCRLASLPDRLEEIETEMCRSGEKLIPIDLLPIISQVLWDKEVQQEYRERMRDPNHVQNMFSSFLRWDLATGTFVKADRKYLDKYIPKGAASL